ncbi:DUF6792 domain-containing protein [Piscinibacter sakaiensis]|uniref:DUF6792 domain-containing protein n=1 Tax=Piscinibacter sakaiensis TaxID=1547922 RepID=UPI003AAA8AA0
MQRATSRFLLRISSTLLLAAALSGCGAALTYYASLPQNDAGNDLSEPSLASDVFLTEMAREFGLMALFADVVYRRDIPADRRIGSGCNYLGGDDAKVPSFGMPHGGPQDGRWKRWNPKIDGVQPCFDASGLYYETYVFEDGDGKLRQAVIAFRGTENRGSQFFYDWSSNLTAFLGFEPNQYTLVRERLPAILAALSARFRADGTPPLIHATGHSLGGGLAQQAGYMSKDVAAVYTFNTSPVTNWSHLRLDGGIGNAYPIFHRVYHGGEILEKIRFISTSFTDARYGRHDIGLQLAPRRAFGGHSMKIISCEFANLIAAQDPHQPARHHYPLSFIEQVVLNPASPDGCERPKDDD